MPPRDTNSDSDSKERAKLEKEKAKLKGIEKDRDKNRDKNCAGQKDKASSSRKSRESRESRESAKKARLSRRSGYEVPSIDTTFNQASGDNSDIAPGESDQESDQGSDSRPNTLTENHNPPHNDADDLNALDVLNELLNAPQQ
ncbi:Protein of unknown function [Pyronema omphalodes CBS 100304]|uniref:Uncharacterized protein n=1 Tax=Pyronema omphalodes (strain CBS 100304) TaxID=1076935 RepID=U4L3J9_PYROM|nr:Protein of unknown function [Pyronema omphalodes CBS 100304]